MAYFIGMHRAGTAQSLPYLESLGYHQHRPCSDGHGSGIPKNVAITAPCVKAASTTAAETGSEQAGPGDVQNELSSESAEQRDGPHANAGIPRGLSHHLGCVNKSTR